jgi:hypothetical protein
VEASALTAMAATKIAERIMDSSNGLAASPPFLIVTGNTMPDFSGWLMFDLRIKYLEDQFADAEAAFNRAYDKALPSTGFKSLGVPSAAAMNTISNAVKLAQLFATDWTAGSITMQPDDYMLAVAIASRSTNALIYNQATMFSAAEVVEGRFSALDKLRQTAANDANRATTQSSQLKEDAKVDKANADKDNNKAAALDAAATKLNATISNYDAFVAQLAGTSASSAPSAAPSPPVASASPSTPGASPSASPSAPGPAPSSSSGLTLGTILQQKAGYDVAKAGGVLFVKMHSAGGAFYTKKNLWSALGAMPFYVSGGVVASYSYVHGDSRKAGLLEMVVPYTKVGNVEQVIDLCSAGADKAGSKGSEYQEYCR